MPFSEIVNKKSELRRVYLAMRASLTELDRKKQDEALVGIILGSSLFKSCKHLLLYFPVRSETDVLPLFSAAIESGKSVYFPLCDKKDHTMRFYRVKNLDTLSVGAYNIPEPTNTEEPFDLHLCSESSDVLCVLPGLAVDIYGTRLGYGGGYYDRFLSDFTGNTVFAAREGFVSADVFPKENTDISVKYTIDTKGVYKNPR